MIVATVLTILITVAAVTILWVAIIPMISNSFAFDDPSVRVDVVTSEGYTVYDIEENVAMVQIKRGADEAEVRNVKIIFSFDGNSYCSVVAAPQPNQALTYSFNLSASDPSFSAPESVSVAPIFIVGGSEREGAVTSRTNIGSGNIVDIPDVLLELGTDCELGGGVVVGGGADCSDNNEICDNSVDDDCDGFIDCADADCLGNVACVVTEILCGDLTCSPGEICPDDVVGCADDVICKIANCNDGCGYTDMDAGSTHLGYCDVSVGCVGGNCQCKGSDGVCEHKPIPLDYLIHWSFNGIGGSPYVLQNDVGDALYDGECHLGFGDEIVGTCKDNTRCINYNNMGYCSVENGSINNDQDYSLSLWFNPLAFSVYYSELIFLQRNMLLYGWLNNDMLQIKRGNDIIGNVTISENDWTHVVLVVQNYMVRIYVNDILIEGGGGITIYPYLGNDLLIGGKGDMNENRMNRFSGKIDEVMYFNRTLGDAEIHALYNAAYNAL